MIKILFVVVIAMLVLAMTSGMKILRHAQFASWEKMKMEFDFRLNQRAVAGQQMNVGATIAKNSISKSIPALLYHGIIDDSSWTGDDTNVSLDEFRKQMFALKKAGYQTVTLAEFNDFMKNGKTFPEKSFLLTFDDGRKDSYYPVDPILRALEYRATMFVITGKSLDDAEKNGFYLDESEILDMAGSGRWEIQSHGNQDHDWEKISEKSDKGHFLSNRLWLSAPKNRLETENEAKVRIVADMATAKEKIERNIDGKVIAFAYPFNDFGQESQNFPGVEQFIRESVGKVYPLTFFQADEKDSIANYPDPKQLLVKRLDVNSNMSTKQLLAILSRNEDKKLPFEDSFQENKGWNALWGTSKILEELELEETEAGGGNLTTLLGSSLWENYIAKSRVRITSGDSISQIVRFKDENNYVRCNFSKTGVEIFEKNGGGEHILAEKTANLNLSLSSEVELAASVSGNTIKCHLNGALELEGKMNPNLNVGGVGIYLWDNLPENAVARIKRYKVDSI